MSAIEAVRGTGGTIPEDDRENDLGTTGNNFNSKA